MEFFKQFEKDLILEWQRAQLELIPHVRAAAIKAYYVKYRAYQAHKRYLSFMAVTAPLADKLLFAEIN